VTALLVFAAGLGILWTLLIIVLVVLIIAALLRYL
jgi:hypothetical protein